MIHSSLKEKAIKVDFDGGFFDWHRRDRKVEKDVTGRAGVSREAIRAKKNLFLGNDSTLHLLRQTVQVARAKSTNMTLPWEPSRRLLLNVNFLPHQKMMVEARSTIGTLLDHLEQDWDAMMAGAKAALGPLFDPDIYPTLEYVKSATYVSATFYPLSDASDVRLQADEEMVKAIQDEVTRNQEKLYSDAVYNTWERLFKIIENAHWNLTKTTNDSRFRTEWLSSLSELVPVLRGLNLAEDPRLDQMADDLFDLAKHTSEDDIKQSWNKRGDAKKAIDKAYSDLTAIFGPMRAEREGK